MWQTAGHAQSSLQIPTLFCHPAPHPLLPQYFVQMFPLVEEQVRKSMGEELYQLFLVSTSVPTRLSRCPGQNSAPVHRMNLVSRLRHLPPRHCLLIPLPILASKLEAGHLSLSSSARVNPSSLAQLQEHTALVPSQAPAASIPRATLRSCTQK